MSTYTYAGYFKNPTHSLTVVPSPEGNGFILAITLTADDILRLLLREEVTKEEAELMRERGWRPQSSSKTKTARVFEEEDEAYEYIESLEESFERDYDEYLEENRHELHRMELYEMWQNEK